MRAREKKRKNTQRIESELADRARKANRDAILDGRLHGRESANGVLNVQGPQAPDAPRRGQTLRKRVRVAHTTAKEGTVKII